MSRLRLFNGLIAGAADSVETIPELQPPEALIRPGFWEIYGGWIALLALLCLAGAWLIRIWLRRPSQQVEEPIADKTRRILQELILKPEDGTVAGEVSLALRRYLPEVMELPREEMTGQEVAWRLQKDPHDTDDLKPKIAEVLRLCDVIKYSSVHPQAPANLAARALALVDKLEARRAEASQVQPATPIREAAPAVNP